MVLQKTLYLTEYYLFFSQMHVILLFFRCRENVEKYIVSAVNVRMIHGREVVSFYRVASLAAYKNLKQKPDLNSAQKTTLEIIYLIPWTHRSCFAHQWYKKFLDKESLAWFMSFDLSKYISWQKAMFEWFDHIFLHSHHIWQVIIFVLNLTPTFLNKSPRFIIF